MNMFPLFIDESKSEGVNYTKIPMDKAQNIIDLFRDGKSVISISHILRLPENLIEKQKKQFDEMIFDNATNFSYSNKKLTVTMTAGQKLRNILISNQQKV